MFSMKADGFDELSKELARISNAAEELEGTHNLSLGQLLTDDFMSSHTEFETFEGLLNAGGYTAKSKEDFEAIPDDELDEHISNTTEFDSLDDMIGVAAEEYAIKRLGF